MSTDDEHRIAYLEGQATESLAAGERAELDALRSLLQAPATWAEPDASLEDRVVQAIAQEARAGAREVEPPPAAAPHARGGRARAPGWRFPSLFARRPYGLVAGFAAAAVVVALVVVLAAGSSGPAPARFAMVVSGTPLAPGAHGSATLTKTASGWRIELSAGGLPHLAGGRYYQAWLKNASGILVPVGTFNDARRVTLWSGVPVTSFRVLTVTIQQANGNPASSGKRVLIGRIVRK